METETRVQILNKVVGISHGAKSYGQILVLYSHNHDQLYKPIIHIHLHMHAES